MNAALGVRFAFLGVLAMPFICLFAWEKAIIIVLVNNSARASHPRLHNATTTREMPRGRGKSAESLRPL
jgi:hypothetical protein